jgi:hypothetical protein
MVYKKGCYGLDDTHYDILFTPARRVTFDVHQVMT